MSAGAPPIQETVMSKGSLTREYGRSPAILPVDQWTEDSVRRIQGRPEIRVCLLEGYDKVDFRVRRTILHYWSARRARF